jgi:SAM-dependent methyltransferase
MQEPKNANKFERRHDMAERNEKEVLHKGWDWNSVSEDVWNDASAEFLPVSVNWAKKYRSMLDVGAGKGRHSFYMNKMGLDVKAIDLSESSIEIINRKNVELGCNVKALQGDMTKLPFDSEEFDCAICFHVIYHTSFEGIGKALSEIRRVLKSGGELFVTFNSKDNPSFKQGEAVNDYTIYKTSGVEKDIPHTYVDFEDVQALMKGFKLIRVQRIKEFVRSGAPASGSHFFVLACKE